MFEALEPMLKGLVVGLVLVGICGLDIRDWRFWVSALSLNVLANI